MAERPTYCYFIYWSFNGALLILDMPMVLTLAIIVGFLNFTLPDHLSFYYGLAYRLHYMTVSVMSTVKCRC